MSRNHGQVVCVDWQELEAGDANRPQTAAVIDRIEVLVKGVWRLFGMSFFGPFVPCYHQLGSQTLP